MRRQVVATLLLTTAALVGAVGARGAQTADPLVTPAAPPSSARIERQLGDERARSAITEISPPPTVSAKSWLVYDAGSDEPIAALDPTTPRPIASLAKLMTAVVVVERAQGSAQVKVPALVNDLPADAAVMGLRAGETWPLRELLQGMLVHSANDAALALALHVADDERAFVDLMNERAQDLQLTDSRFGSATGLDRLGGTSSASAVDLVALAEAALADPDIAAAVAMPKLEVRRPGAAATSAPIVLPNRNPLVGSYKGVDGVKTGFTDEAGYMLVVHHVDEATEGQLMVVTAASTSEATRASDARALLDWARPLRSDVLIAEAGEQVASIPVLDDHRRRVRVFVCDDASVSARVGQRVATSFVLPEMVDPPISAGDEIGELRTTVAGADAGTVPLCSATSIADDGWRGRVRTAVRDYDTAWDAGIEEVERTWAKLAG